jgi:heterodisulfide reductase subunit A
VYEPILQREVEIKADLVVLATGMVSNLTESLAECYGSAVDADGFFLEADFKWRPVDSLQEGVFACGGALSPGPAPDAIAEGEAAAQRALRILSRERLAGGDVTAEVRHALCARCERCVEACPYGARHLDLEADEIRVNPAACQGCGSCAVACPNGAAVVEGFQLDQMLNMIDAAFV